MGDALVSGMPVQDIRQANNQGQPALFSQVRHVLTRQQTAEQLWRKLEKKNPSLPRLIYFTFLSEVHGIEIFIYQYLHSLFNIGRGEASRLPEWRQRLEGVARRVELEKRELERDMPFRASQDGVLCAWASPSHNSLPLLTRHFRNRYSGQSWMVYDARRNYGIHCRGGQLELIGCRTGALGPFMAMPGRERVGNPEIFGAHPLHSLLLPKVVQQARAATNDEAPPIRSAV